MLLFLFLCVCSSKNQTESRACVCQGQKQLARPHTHKEGENDLAQKQRCHKRKGSEGKGGAVLSFSLPSGHSVAQQESNGSVNSPRPPRHVTAQ